MAAGRASASGSGDVATPSRSPSGNSLGETIAVSEGDRGAITPGLPAKIGRYRILRRLDEGGMGTVYQAEQDKPRRVVALKVIRPGRMSAQHLRRFEHESQILGRLQHPGIAQIYEAGTAESGGGVQPFFAMEYIAGAKPITAFAQAGELGTRQRMELVARICDAVHHAHQKGVIHRDLKPDNIVVDATGQPKILDFGVAKATESDIQATTMHTDVGQLIGTLYYMSPEQVVADPLELDVRSDVYALGVILYELLSQRMPYDIAGKPVHEAARMIREQEATRLSIVSRVFRGDVETIVAKALEKDKSRRYQSAAELGADIRRYLASEPIVARPPSTLYQVKKFAQRNRAFVVAVAVVFVVMLGATAVSTWLAIRATDAERVSRLERDRAQTEAAKSEQTTRFIQGIFAGIDPYQAQGMDTTLLRHLLERAEARIGKELAMQPEVEAAIRLTLGRGQYLMAAFDRAEVNVRRAIELLVGALGERHRETLSARLVYATLLQRRGDHAGGVREAREVLSISQSDLGENAPEALEAMSDVGIGLTFMGRYVESEMYLRRSLEGKRKLYGDDDRRTIEAMQSLGQVLKYLQRYPEAESLLKRALDLRVRDTGPESAETFEVMARLAMVWQGMDRFDEAESYFRKSVDGMSRLLGPEHQQTMTMRNNLAACLSEMGRKDDALAMFRENLEMRRRTLGPEHPETLFGMYNVGDALRERGRLDEAEPLLRTAMEGRRRLLGMDHIETIDSTARLVLLLSAQRRFEEAADLQREVVAADRRRFKPEDPSLGLSLYNRAAVLQNMTLNNQAEPIYREVIESYERYRWKEQPFLAATFNGLAKALDDRGERVEAESNYQKGLEIRRRLHKTPDMDLVYSLTDYGWALVRWERFGEAEPLWREALALCADKTASDDTRCAIAQGGMGASLIGLHRFADAEPFALASCDALRNSVAVSPDVSLESIQRMVRLYENWDKAEPGKGFANKATDWRAVAAEVEERRRTAAESTGAQAHSN